MTEWRRVASPYRAYEVSDSGQVRRDGRLLSPTADRYGYLHIGLYYGGLRKRCKLHRLVCETFHGPAPSERHEVCHADGDKGNNTPSNLRWGTRAENTADAIRLGTFSSVSTGDVSGENHPNARLSAEQVAELRSMRGISQRSLARMFGISQTQVCHIMQGKRWADRQSP